MSRSECGVEQATSAQELVLNLLEPHKEPFCGWTTENMLLYLLRTLFFMQFQHIESIGTDWLDIKNSFQTILRYVQGPLTPS